MLETWMLEVVVVGGIYSPNHQTNRWGGCLSMAHRTLSGATVTSPNR
jgi:hypothetical protein